MGRRFVTLRLHVTAWAASVEPEDKTTTPASRTAQPAALFQKRRIRSRLRAAGFVDELGARAAALENDLALMKGGEFRAMTDADDGRICEFPRQKSHQTILAA